MWDWYCNCSGCGVVIKHVAFFTNFFTFTSLSLKFYFYTSDVVVVSEMDRRISLHLFTPSLKELRTNVTNLANTYLKTDIRPYTALDDLVKNMTFSQQQQQ